MIDATFINAIKNLCDETRKVDIKEIDGRLYSTGPRLEPVLLPQITPITVTTLTAVSDYLVSNPDRLELPNVIVTVDSPVQITLRSALKGPFNQRDICLTAKMKEPDFQYNAFIALEKFIISLQADFVPSDTVDQILKVIGTLSDGVVKQFADDGVTQSVTARTGIARLGEVPVPNPVILAPYRTFIEVEQPSSRFIFRMKSGEQQPQCGLFEADGGAWVNQAMADIKAWLAEHLPYGVVILS